FISPNSITKIEKANILRNFEYEYKLNELYENNDAFVSYHRDNFGLRSKCKNNKDIEILTVGGSTTDQRYVKLESTYQSILENHISNLIKRKFCISNAGVDGHTTFGHIYSFNNWFPLIPDLKPKYVILYIGINDADFLRIGANKGYDINDNTTIKGLLLNLYIFKKIMPLVRYIQTNLFRDKSKYANHLKFSFEDNDYTITELNPNTKKLSELNAKLFEERLKIILQQINLMESQHICITQPHIFVQKKLNNKKGIPNVFGENYSGLDFDYSLNSLNEKMKKLCGKYFIDINYEKFKKSYFYDGVHTTEIGSEFLGNLIYEKLQLKGLLDIFQ
ncbi:hypothetical protein OAO21_05790, partial [Alphaproteobacteria bacterium]|nr:hypothetical protein [Alphaproteobacteria bacterium]